MKTVRFEPAPPFQQLVYLEEHSLHEIAAILAVPAEMVMARIAQGKKRLRRQLRAAASCGQAGA